MSRRTRVGVWWVALALSVFIYVLPGSGAGWTVLTSWVWVVWGILGLTALITLGAMESDRESMRRALVDIHLVADEVARLDGPREDIFSAAFVRWARIHSFNALDSESRATLREGSRNRSGAIRWHLGPHLEQALASLAEDEGSQAGTDTPES